MHFNDFSQNAISVLGSQALGRNTYLQNCNYELKASNNIRVVVSLGNIPEKQLS